MSNQIFNLRFNAGDECYAVLTGLDRALNAAQFEMDQMAAFGSRFDQLRRKIVNGSVTFDSTAMFEGLCDSCILEILDTLIFWLDEIVAEYVIDVVITHPKAAVDEAVTALKAFRDRAPSVTMCEEAAWEIQDCANLLWTYNINKLEAAQAVYERAIDL